AGRQGDNPLGAAGDGDGAAGIVSEGVRVAGVGVGAGPGGTAVGIRRRGSAASAAGGRQQQRSSQGEDQQAVDTTNPGRGPGSGKDTHARYPLIREGDTPGVAGRSPGFRVVAWASAPVPAFPSCTDSGRNRLPGHSGGTAPDSHRLPYSPRPFAPGHPRPQVI